MADTDLEYSALPTTPDIVAGDEVLIVRSGAPMRFIGTLPTENGLADAVAAAQSARDQALAYGTGTIKATWAEVAALTGQANGAIVNVVSSDTGTHASVAGDYGAAGGQTPNAGVFRYSTSLSAFVRMADLESSVAKGWAEGLTAPGGAGTKSAKSWAADAQTSVTIAGDLATASGAAAGLAEAARDEVVQALLELGPLSLAYNPNDIGYDIILKIGQSNESGYGETGYNASIDNIPHARVKMLNAAGAVVPAGIPIHEVSGPGVLAPNYGFELAKLIAAATPTNRTILLAPCSQGSTGFGTYWDAGNPGGVGYENAIAVVNAAIAANPGSRLALIEWLGGEANSGTATATYASWWDAMITGLRSRITGAANCPVIIGQMVPEAYADLGDPVDLAHQQSPQRLQYVGFWPGTRGNSGVDETFHYDAATTRANVPNAYEAVFRARHNVIGIRPGAPLSFTMSRQGVGFVDFTWKRPVQRVTAWKLRYRRKGTGDPFTLVTIPAELDGYRLGGLFSAGGSAVYEGQLLAHNESGDGFPTPLIDFSPMTQVGAILDILGVAAGRAFSMVRVKSAYAGNSLKVRRSSDNALADIPFLAGGITDFKALMDHVTVGGTVPSASGYVHTQYSQDGASHDRIQATNANQPRIVNAGVLCTKNGVPGIEFYNNGGTATYLEAAAGNPAASDLTLLHCGSVSPTVNQYALTHNFYGQNGGYALTWGPRFNFLFYSEGGVGTDPVIFKEVDTTIAATFDNAAKAAVIYANGATVNMLTPSPSFASTVPASAGGQTGSAGPGNVSLQYIGVQHEELILPVKLTAGQVAAYATFNAALYGTTGL